MKLTESIRVAGEHVIVRGRRDGRTYCGRVTGLAGWETSAYGSGIRCGECRRAIRAAGILVAEFPSASACEMPEAHEGHMQMNGECPWCGAVDGDRIREPRAWDFPDAGTVER